MANNNNFYNTHAIILAGGVDFGRCMIAKKKPVCLWPVANKSAIINTLEWLKKNNISTVTICFDGDNSLIKEEINKFSPEIAVDFLDESLPLGTAGCVREAIKSHNKADIFLACKATSITPPSLHDFVESHISSNKMLSVAVNPASRLRHDSYEAAGMYLFSRDACRFMPELGYCDIKERFIPNLVQNAIQINTYRLNEQAGAFRDIQSYCKAFYQVLSNEIEKVVPEDYISLDNNIYISPSVKIAPDAKLFGPLIIGENVTIGSNTIIFGPGIIHNNVSIKDNCFLEANIIWEQVDIGNCSQIRHSFINSQSKIDLNVKLSKEVIYH